MRWYTVQVRPGREKTVIADLQYRFANSEFKSDFEEIFVPAEEVIERKDGKEKISERKFYPSYLFVRMHMRPETWHLISRAPMVKGFVGDPNKRGAAVPGAKWKEPAPLADAEIEKIRARVLERSDKPRPKIEFSIGENVRIKAGAFADFLGDVTDVNYEQSRITVRVNVFSKQTPVEIDFEQVEKI
ncbi:MAG: transcription termination/antitermination protein NusG [Betaproteobacteria bacterium]|nr:transcription termination/antitermination protein NusG [Betaproteobacteria bacterium]